MKMKIFFSITLAILFTITLGAQEVSLPRITARMNLDSTFVVEIVQAGQMPQSITRYPSLSEKAAISVVNSWVEKQSRSRAAAQYALLLSQLSEQQAIKDAQAIGLKDPVKSLQPAILKLFAGSWLFKAPGEIVREISISDNGSVQGLEQEGSIDVMSTYEFTLKSGGASMRFVSNDGNLFAAIFGSGFYILERKK